MPIMPEDKSGFTIVGRYRDNDQIIVDHIEADDETEALDKFWADPNSPMRKDGCDVLAMFRGFHTDKVPTQFDEDSVSYGDWLEEKDRREAQLIEAKTASPHASFSTRCPYCREKDCLEVVHLEAMTCIPLTKDGFATTDAGYFETSEEVVHCTACDREFSLGEVTL